MRLEIDLLGRFAARCDGQPVASGEFGGRLAQRLVRLLAVRRGEVVTRDALIDALWDDSVPADPEANLNVLVNRARRGLGDRTVIETVAGGYLFSAATDIAVDTERFEAHLRTARAETRHGNPRRALAAVRAALGLWRGEPLPEDTYADWAQPHRDRLHRAHQEALELGAAAALAVGDLPRAFDLASEAVRRQPLREAAHLLHLRALAAGGDTAGALAAYEELRRRLAGELGITPSREAEDLHRRLLRGETFAGRPANVPPVTDSTALAAAPFVGRGREVARLRGLGGDQRVGLVAGRSGTGKSRLLHETTREFDRRVLVARAVLPERAVPWSLARVLLRAVIEAGTDPVAVLPSRSLAALSDLLPELADSGSTAPVDAQSRRALVLEGAARLVAASGRAAVIVDDLQWADASSLDLLAVLAARAEETTMILSYRPEDIEEGQEAAAFLTGIRATTRPLEIGLGPLDTATVLRMVDSPEMASLLVRATDGTAFGILEVIRALERQGALRRDAGTWRLARADALDRASAEAHAGKRRAVALRAGRQPRARRELLDLLALLGRPAPAQLLAVAAGSTPGEVGTWMDALAQAELVRHDERGWAVAHDIVGEVLRDHLDPVGRARLHQMLARALEEGLEGGTDAAGERAHHLAGAGDRPAAAACYAVAARQRLERFAGREAERLAEAGLALDPGDPVRGELLEIRAETRFRAGNLGGAREDLRSALVLASAGADRSRLLARLARLASGAEDLVRAANLVDLALAEAGDDPGPRAKALAVAAIIDMNLERPHRAEARYTEALSLFERVGDANGVADVLDARAMATFLDGDITSGVRAFDRVARLFADAGNLFRVVTPRSTRGHGLVFAAAPREGLADTEEALELARSLGSPEGETYALWHLSEALTACGRTAEGTATAAEALAIAERIGHRGWTATALRALGVAHQADGALDEAEYAFRRSLAASERLPLFACWAHARLGLVLVAAGKLEEAHVHAERALATGPPLGHYEARLARCELAVSRAEAGAAELVAEATGLADRGGHYASLGRLSALRALVSA